MTDNLRQTTGTLLYEGTDIHKLGREYRRHIGVYCIIKIQKVAKQKCRLLQSKNVGDCNYIL